MSKDKKPCSSCLNSLDLAPSINKVKDAINKFTKNSQTIIAKSEQHFKSQNDRYKMTSYLKTKPIKDKVELFILQVISKYDVNTKKSVLFNWFKAPSQTTNETESVIMLKFFNAPTNYFDLKLVMFTIGKLISSGKTEKSKALKSSTNCCQHPSGVNYCFGQQMTTNQYPQTNPNTGETSTNYKCNCSGNSYCYSGDSGCQQINCDDVNPNPTPPIDMIYVGQTATSCAPPKWLC
jgi:hypothetical protein